MNKFYFLLIILLVQSTWAENNEKPILEKNSQIEDEEIIGGIGGTGLYDMDRPELIERPELDLEISRDVIDVDHALDLPEPPSDVNDIPE